METSNTSASSTVVEAAAPVVAAAPEITPAVTQVVEGGSISEEGITEPEVTPIKPPEDPMHKRFQALTKREKLLQEKSQRAAAELQARQAEIDAKLNRLKHLEEMEARLQQFENPPPPETTDERVARLEKMLADKEAAEIQRQQEYEANLRQSQATQAIDSYTQSIATVASKDSDTYELFNSNQEQAMNLAVEVARQYFVETNVILEPKDVVEYVEEYLTEQYQAQFQKMSSLKKLRAREEPTNKETQVVQAAQTQPPKSLNNSNTSGSSIAPTPREPWNPEKSKAEAAKLLKWT